MYIDIKYRKNSVSRILIAVWASAGLFDCSYISAPETAAIQFLNPQGGEIFTLLDTVAISARYDTSQIQSIRLQFSLDSGQHFSPITCLSVAHSQDGIFKISHYAWVPLADSVSNGSVVFLAVSNQNPQLSCQLIKPVTIKDSLDTPIQLLFPAGGETFHATDTISILVRRDFTKILAAAIQFSKDTGGSFHFVTYEDKSTFIAGKIAQDIFRWIPVADTLQNVKILLRTFSYMDPQYVDQLPEPVAIQ